METIAKQLHAEEQKRGVAQVAAVLKRGLIHGKDIGELYLDPEFNTPGLVDNLNALIDVWQAQHLGTLDQITAGQQPAPQCINYLAMVAQFHHTFKSPVLEWPRIPSPQRVNLRVDLLTEELQELIEALVDKDLVAVADALCDLQYVLSGAILEFGMGQIFGQLFNEVHRSNMSKACLTEAEAQATVAKYKEQDTASYYVESEGTYIVYRTDDNKTLKSVNYSPADLETLINKAQQ